MAQTRQHRDFTTTGFEYGHIPLDEGDGAGNEAPTSNKYSEPASRIIAASRMPFVLPTVSLVFCRQARFLTLADSQSAGSNVAEESDDALADEMAEFLRQQAEKESGMELIGTSKHRRHSFVFLNSVQ